MDSDHGSFLYLGQKEQTRYFQHVMDKPLAPHQLASMSVALFGALLEKGKIAEDEMLVATHVNIYPAQVTLIEVTHTAFGSAPPPRADKAREDLLSLYEEGPGSKARTTAVVEISDLRPRCALSEASAEDCSDLRAAAADFIMTGSDDVVWQPYLQRRVGRADAPENGEPPR